MSNENTDAKSKPYVRSTDAIVTSPATFVEQREAFIAKLADDLKPALQSHSEQLWDPICTGIKALCEKGTDFAAMAEDPSIPDSFPIFFKDKESAVNWLRSSQAEPLVSLTRRAKETMNSVLISARLVHSLGLNRPLTSEVPFEQIEEELVSSFGKMVESSAGKIVRESIGEAFTGAWAETMFKADVLSADEPFADTLSKIRTVFEECLTDPQIIDGADYRERMTTFFANLRQHIVNFIDHNNCELVYDEKNPDWYALVRRRSLVFGADANNSTTVYEGVCPEIKRNAVRWLPIIIRNNSATLISNLSSNRWSHAKYSLDLNCPYEIIYNPNLTDTLPVAGEVDPWAYVSDVAPKLYSPLSANKVETTRLSTSSNQALASLRNALIAAFGGSMNIVFQPFRRDMNGIVHVFTLVGIELSGSYTNAGYHPRIGYNSLTSDGDPIQLRLRTIGELRQTLAELSEYRSYDSFSQMGEHFRIPSSVSGYSVHKLTQNFDDGAIGKFILNPLRCFYSQGAILLFKGGPGYAYRLQSALNAKLKEVLNTDINKVMVVSGSRTGTLTPANQTHVREEAIQYIDWVYSAPTLKTPEFETYVRTMGCASYGTGTVITGLTECIYEPVKNEDPREASLEATQNRLKYNAQLAALSSSTSRLNDVTNRLVHLGAMSVNFDGDLDPVNGTPMRLTTFVTSGMTSFYTDGAFPSETGVWDSNAFRIRCLATDKVYFTPEPDDVMFHFFARMSSVIRGRRFNVSNSPTMNNIHPDDLQYIESHLKYRGFTPTQTVHSILFVNALTEAGKRFVEAQQAGEASAQMQMLKYTDETTLAPIPLDIDINEIANVNSSNGASRSNTPQLSPPLAMFRPSFYRLDSSNMISHPFVCTSHFQQFWEKIIPAIRDVRSSALMAGYSQYIDGAKLEALSPTEVIPLFSTCGESETVPAHLLVKFGKMWKDFTNVVDGMHEKMLDNNIPVRTTKDALGIDLLNLPAEFSYHVSSVFRRVAVNWSDDSSYMRPSEGQGSTGIPWGHNSHRIYNYSTDVLEYLPPAPSKQTGEIQFGVEWEVSIKSAFSVDSALWNMGAINPFHVMAKSDSSISRGFEIVSRPASLAEHKKCFAPFFNADREFIGKVYGASPSTGIHIHISRKNLTAIQIAKMVAFLHRPHNRDFVQAIAGRSANRYCDWSTAKSIKTSLIRSGNRYKVVDPDHNRYTALNLTKVNTVEVRIFSGTADMDTFFKNLEFVAALVEFTGPDTLTNLKEVTSFEAFVKWVGSNRIKQYPYLTKWLQLNKYLPEKKINWKEGK